MKSDQIPDRRPTALEKQAYSEAKQKFADHLTQFGFGRDAIHNLERNIVSAAHSVNEAASRRSEQGDPLLTDDGLKWHKCVDLFDNICVCHRPTGAGLEFAVVERWGLKPCQRCEVLVKGCDALELLRAFIVNQREVLRLWIGEVAAQVRENFAEKYPGHDLTRVADSLMNRLTVDRLNRETIGETERQKRSRGGPHLNYGSSRRRCAHAGLVILGSGLSALICRCIGCFVVGSERHLRSHALGVFPAQMSIDFQRQHSAVTVPKPARNCRNVNPALNTSRRKQVPQGMVR